MPRISFGHDRCSSSLNRIRIEHLRKLMNAAVDIGHTASPIRKGGERFCRAKSNRLSGCTSLCRECEMAAINRVCILECSVFAGLASASLEKPVEQQ